MKSEIYHDWSHDKLTTVGDKGPRLLDADNNQDHRIIYL